MRVLYDTDAMRDTVNLVARTAGNLHAASEVLAGNWTSEAPAALAAALTEFGRRGNGLVSDIANDGDTLARRLSQAADSYDELERSVSGWFGAG
jgi:hypothetical protein